jgi:hypothetical protein
MDNQTRIDTPAAAAPPDISLVRGGPFYRLQEKWIIHGEENEEEVIAAPEISTLCDYNSAYNNVEDMNPIPVDKEALTGLALAIAIPALPVILAQVPIQVVLQDLLEALK